MTMQIRPNGNGPALSPSRDIAYRFVEITAAGMTLLTLEQLRDEDRLLLDQLPDGLKTVQDCATALGNAITRFVGPQRASDVVTALRDSGYLNAPPMARFLVEAAIGRALFSFGCHGLREVTYAGFTQPGECKLQSALIASGFLNDTDSFKQHLDAVAAAQLQFRVDELERENERLRRAIQYDRTKLKEIE